MDDHLAEAHASLGLVKFYYEWDWNRAEAEFKKALDLNPGYAQAHQYYADFVKSFGRFDEALGEMKKVLTLRPVIILDQHRNRSRTIPLQTVRPGHRPVPKSCRVRPLLRPSTALVRETLLAERHVQGSHLTGRRSSQTIARDYRLACHSRAGICRGRSNS